MQKIVLALLCAGLLAGATFAQADRGDWRGGYAPGSMKKTQESTGELERGSLTRREEHRLRGELHRVLREIEIMKDDGHLSYRERERINADLDRLDRDISREKHNDNEYGHRHRGYRR